MRPLLILCILIHLMTALCRKCANDADCSDMTLEDKSIGQAVCYRPGICPNESGECRCPREFVFQGEICMIKNKINLVQSKVEKIDKDNQHETVVGLGESCETERQCPQFARCMKIKSSDLFNPSNEKRCKCWDNFELNKNQCRPLDAGVQKFCSKCSAVYPNSVDGCLSIGHIEKCERNQVGGNWRVKCMAGYKVDYSLIDIVHRSSWAAKISEISTGCAPRTIRDSCFADIDCSKINGTGAACKNGYCICRNYSHVPNDFGTSCGQALKYGESCVNEAEDNSRATYFCDGSKGLTCQYECSGKMKKSKCPQSQSPLPDNDYDNPSNQAGCPAKCRCNSFAIDRNGVCFPKETGSKCKSHIDCYYISDRYYSLCINDTCVSPDEQLQQYLKISKSKIWTFGEEDEADTDPKQKSGGDKRLNTVVGESKNSGGGARTPRNQPPCCKGKATNSTTNIAYSPSKSAQTIGIVCLVGVYFTWFA